MLNEGWGLGGDPATPGIFKWGLIGTKGFFLHGVNDVSVMALFFFMMVFMDTTATIPTGTMAERWAWKNFCLFGLWVALPYCIYANWVWGGGWLAQLGINSGYGHGAVDFAGSGVVHSMGGVIALVGGILIGPRIGKYVNGKPQAIPGHNIPAMVMVCYRHRSFWPSAGSASIRGRRWPEPTCALPMLWSIRCWPEQPRLWDAWSG